MKHNDSDSQLAAALNKRVMQTLPLAFVKWYSGREEVKILKAYERWKKESGIVSVASSAVEKGVSEDECVCEEGFKLTPCVLLGTCIMKK